MRPFSKDLRDNRFYGTAPLLTSEAALTAATVALRSIDPDRLGPILDLTGPLPLRRRQPGFTGLAAIIVSQQVSTASADAMFARLAAALEPFTPETLAAATDERLRAAGLSGNKISTLRASARAIMQGVLPIDDLGAMPAETAHRTLVAVKGIGPWTADIFLLFCLGHPDAWPAGDLALQETARAILALPTRPSAAELEHLGEGWRPYRGVAARLLWAYYRVLKGRRGIGLDPS